MERTSFGLAGVLLGLVLLSPVGADEKVKIRIDGSSTLYPVTLGLAEPFAKRHPNVGVVCRVSGTSSGFRKFIAGELEIVNAGRLIKPAEKEACKRQGIDFLELPVATDALVLVVHPMNEWCQSLSVKALKQLWMPKSKITQWSELDPAWPQEQISLYGPDADSEMYDFFDKAVVGGLGIRSDYLATVDDNFTVLGVSRDRFGLGLVPYGYYAKHKEKLKALAILPQGQKSPILPTPNNILAGTYTPLARPLFFYVSKTALEKQQVAEFLTFSLGEGQKLIRKKSLLPLNAKTLLKTQTQLKQAISGSE